MHKLSRVTRWSLAYSPDRWERYVLGAWRGVSSIPREPRLREWAGNGMCQANKVFRFPLSRLVQVFQDTGCAWISALVWIHSLFPTPQPPCGISSCVLDAHVMHIKTIIIDLAFGRELARKSYAAGIGRRDLAHSSWSVNSEHRWCLVGSSSHTLCALGRYSKCSRSNVLCFVRRLDFWG